MPRRTFSTGCYAYHALRYVEANPVRAGLAATPEAWPWGSASARILGGPVSLASFPASGREGLDMAATVELGQTLRRNVGTGRPLGNGAFVEDLERQYPRPPLRPQKRGRKPKKWSK